jgi:hypothetical protein
MTTAYQPLDLRRNDMLTMRAHTDTQVHQYTGTQTRPRAQGQHTDTGMRKLYVGWLRVENGIGGTALVCSDLGFLITVRVNDASHRGTLPTWYTLIS